MPAFVLIHSPVAGPLTWERIAQALEKRGHRAVVPTLDYAAAPYWPYFARLVAESVENTQEDQPLVLVAHSAAGLLIPAVEATIRNPEIRGSIFVDASLPHAGMSLVELIPVSAGIGIEQLRAEAKDGLLPPWGEGWSNTTWQELIPDVGLRARFRDELRPVPLALYEERVPTILDGPSAPCSYLRFSVRYEDAERQARQLGCRTRHLPGGHLHMLVEPAAVAEVLIELAVQMLGGEAT